MATLTLPGRFNGPPTSSNGGYAAGRLAAHLDADTVTVRLRRPPRLDAELTVRHAGDAVELLDGDELVATAAPATLPSDEGLAATSATAGPAPASRDEATAAGGSDATAGPAPASRDDATPAGRSEATAGPAPGVPAAPALEQARAAAAARGPRTEHPFPTCFGCGPARPAGESVAALLGPLHDGPAWAGTWTPTARLPHDGDRVDDAMVWVALDCPSAQPIAPDDGPAHVLGSFTVQRLAPVALEVEHVLLAWPIGDRDGRKQRAGSAVLRADGTLCARAEALWFALS